MMELDARSVSSWAHSQLTDEFPVVSPHHLIMQNSTRSDNARPNMKHEVSLKILWFLLQRTRNPGLSSPRFKSLVKTFWGFLIFQALICQALGNISLWSQGPWKISRKLSQVGSKNLTADVCRSFHWNGGLVYHVWWWWLCCYCTDRFVLILLGSWDLLVEVRTYFLLISKREGIQDSEVFLSRSPKWFRWCKGCGLSQSQFFVTSIL